MKSTKNNRYRLIVLLSITFLFVVLLIVLGKWAEPKQVVVPSAPTLPATPVIEPEFQQLFVDTIAKGVVLNSGLTMERLGFLAVIEGPTPSPNEIGFDVYNHTNEKINFTNQGFGLQIYWLDKSSKKWEIVNLAVHPGPEPRSLPAKLEEFSFDIVNSWYIAARELTDVPYSELRLYISGTGAVSGKRYGAYLDVTLVK